jgi:hypothetical protein
MNPKRLPVRSPKINKKSTGVIANAHNECMRVQRIRKSQRQRNKVPRVWRGCAFSNKHPFKEGGGKRCGDTPIQPTTRICSSGWGCLVVLQAVSNAGRTAQLKRGVSVRQQLRRRYACKYVRGTRMFVVCCSENCAWV